MDTAFLNNKYDIILSSFFKSGKTYFVKNGNVFKNSILFCALTIGSKV